VRTNIDIDDTLMLEAMKATGVKTKRAVIDKALRKLVALKVHEEAVEEASRLQEVARKKAEQEGRLEEWRAELVAKGNWPEWPSEED